MIDVEIEVPETQSKKSFRLQLDTGSDSAVVLTDFEARKLELALGNPINHEPTIGIMADLTEAGEWTYDIILRFKGIEIPTMLSVLETKTNRTPTEEEKANATIDVIGLLGREIMDSYKVIFDGLANPRKFSFLQ